MSVSSLFSQQQHQQQHQQFHPSFHSFHTSGYETQPHHYYAQGEPQLQYFQSHQGNIQSSFQDDPQSLDHSQQLYFQHPQQDLLEAQNSPLRSNYFSTPRNDSTIHVAAGKSPTENMNLARKFLVHHEIVYLSAFDAAIVIAIDAALLLQRSKYATIVRVETDTEDRVEMQQRNRNDSSPSFAPIVKRPQIRITLQRNEEFVHWLTENKNDAGAI
ncbi:hypothetical protein FisN_27Hh109 [Fistulifera solaris]|uniref:Uncharacterized protein n=1 Tax=Fistulifera solaris TaxID=1519565 RepID=A0A1Z5KQF2_FISSO|nr:hypothetical protein FisN_27Hh109 [Fistulifera solaris]|eukprot:GAX28241.1 hypothetical protein FisN_27Hh109 [Fistulifera solaris]